MSSFLIWIGYTLHNLVVDTPFDPFGGLSSFGFLSKDFCFSEQQDRCVCSFFICAIFSLNLIIVSLSG
jgi:hypothetical protein